MISFRVRSLRPGGWSQCTKFATGLLAIALSCSSAFAADAATSGPSVKQGDQIFHQRCVVCHNKQPGDNTPFGPPNLYTVFHGHPAVTTAQAVTIVTNGKGQMPSFKGILTPSEIRSVIAYLRSTH